MFDCLIMMTKHTFLIPMPIPPDKIAFHKDNPITKIPCKYFNL
jgi:hypothetical protein